MARSVFTPSNIGKENIRTAKRMLPYSQIEIHTYSDTYGPGRTIDPSKSLLTWTYQKKLSSQSETDEVGTLNLTLTAGIYGQSQAKDWTELISPMDLIVVYVAKDKKSTMRTRFIGYVTDVYYVTDTQSDPTNPTRHVQITASDLMMGLQTEIVFPSILLSTVNNDKSSQFVQSFLNSLGRIESSFGTSINANSLPLLAFLANKLHADMSTNQLLLMDPSTAAQLVLEKLLGSLFSPVVHIRNQNWAGPARYLDLFTQAFDATYQFSGAEYFVQPQDGTFYSMLAPMMNPPFLEFFGDVRSADQMGGISPPYNGPVTSAKPGIVFGPDNATFNMVIRNTPFNTTSGVPNTSDAAFEKLPMTDVMLKETSGQEWGRTLEDVVNYYYVMPQGYLQQDGTVVAAVNTLYGPLLDADSIVKYGLQPMEISILGYPDSEGAWDPSYIQKFEQCLYDWYHLNPEFIRGTANIHGDPSVRIGQRIRFPSTGLIGYVEGINETYVAMQSYTAQVTFSRGVIAS